MLNLRGSYARGRLHGSAFSGAYQRPSQQALAILWPGGRSLWLLFPLQPFQFINLNFSLSVSEGFLGCIWSRWSMPEILNLSQDLLIMYILSMYINMISRLRAHMCKHHSKALQPFCSTWTPLAFEFKPLKLFVDTWKSRDSSLGYFNLQQNKLPVAQLKIQDHDFGKIFLRSNPALWGDFQCNLGAPYATKPTKKKGSCRGHGANGWSLVGQLRGWFRWMHCLIWWVVPYKCTKLRLLLKHYAGVWWLHTANVSCQNAKETHVLPRVLAIWPRAGEHVALLGHRMLLQLGHMYRHPLDRNVPGRLTDRCIILEYSIRCFWCFSFQRLVSKVNSFPKRQGQDWE